MNGLFYFVMTLILGFIIYKKYKKHAIDMWLGLYIGFLFFVLMPILFSFFIGDIRAVGLRIDIFNNQSMAMSLYIFLFLFGIMTAEMITKSLKKSFNTEQNKNMEKYFNEKSFNYILYFTFFTLFFTFYISGKLSGNHWADVNIQGSWHTFILSFNLSMRLTLFAIALYLSDKKNYNKILFIFVIVDVFTTGNRISVLYYLIFFILANKLKFKDLLLVILASVPLFLFISMYPIFRGVLWSNYQNIYSIADVFFQVIDNASYEFHSDMIFNVFEASNLAVFQYVFNTFGHALDFNYGETVFLKPATIIIPRSIWVDKPHGIGAMLGYMISGNPKLSLNTLLLGEYWINFGWYSYIFITINFVWLFILIALIKKSLHLLHLNIQNKIIDMIAFFIFFSSWRHETNYIYLTLGISLLSLSLFFLIFKKSLILNEKK